MINLRKIKISKQNRIIIFSVISVVAVFILFILLSSENKQKCKEIKIKFKGESQSVLIDSEDVISLVLKISPDIIGCSISKINTKVIEDSLNNSSIVKHAEVYINIGGVLLVEIAETVPIVRIINSQDKTYYIDKEGFLVPVSKKYPKHLLIANGNIKANSTDKKTNIETDSIYLKTKLHRIYEIALTIYNDSFFKNQIEQIYVNNNDEIELVPRIGNHIILIGDEKDCSKKLENLKNFYLNSDKKEWNKYTKINIKYANQVICTKRVG